MVFMQKAKSRKSGPVSDPKANLRYLIGDKKYTISVLEAQMNDYVRQLYEIEKAEAVAAAQAEKKTT